MQVTMHFLIWRMRRLAANDLLPERAGQPVKAWVHISLADLMRLEGDAAAALICDAAMAPVVTGEVNVDALDELVRLCVELDRHRRGADRQDGTGAGGQDGTGAGGQDGTGAGGQDGTDAGGGTTGS